ncbi:MAG: flavodoxin [Candidatus Latescibacterota bacterium]|nr:MAG: flavodoxin [Candidatus Latescibacterota bacterium]RKY70269.1 MAG: flavodoxin [Candidatus Latescibacterota bacterium]
MAKAIVIYGSTTGNTERLSEAVVAGLKKGGVEVTVREVTETNVNELTDYDLIVLGSSTWGEGELQDDFVDFYNKMGSVSLAGKKAAAFGPGDSEFYPDTFCAAVDLLEYRLKECGAEIVARSLKVDGNVDAATEDAEAWGIEVAESV